MQFTIYENNHYPKPRKWFHFHSGIDCLKKSIILRNNCFYNSNSKEINQLFGFTFDLFGRNSLKIGWSVQSGETGMNSIILYGYVTIDGTKYVPLKITDQIIGKYFSFDLTINCSIYWKNNVAYFSAKQGQYQGEHRVVKIPFSKVPGYGYYQYPCFEANTCPKTMDIIFED